MAATPEQPATTTPRRKAGRHRGEGQWAVGHHTPLNGNEQFKKDDDGLNVRTRIETIYSKRGFDSIDPNDLRGRMRWWGLYTQRKPGIDGGKTAILEPEELDDKYFMLRVRIDGGRIDHRAAARHRRDLAGVRTRHRGHHRPAEHPAALDPHRGRSGDLGEAGGRRALHHRGVRRLPACDHRFAGGGDRRRRDHRRHARGRRDPRPLHRQQGILQPAAQVQDRDLRLTGAGRGPRDQRHRVRRRGPPGARSGLRRLGRWRALHQPAARRTAGRLGAVGRGPGRLGRCGGDLP